MKRSRAGALPHSVPCREGFSFHKGFSFVVVRRTTQQDELPVRHYLVTKSPISSNLRFQKGLDGTQRRHFDIFGSSKSSGSEEFLVFRNGSFARSIRIARHHIDRHQSLVLLHCRRGSCVDDLVHDDNTLLRIRLCACCRFFDILQY